MSRKAMEKSLEAAIVIAHIEEYLKQNNISVLKLSRAADVSQPALYRFLSGDRKTVTKVARRCMEYICGDRCGNNRHNNYAKCIIDPHSSNNNSSIDTLIGFIREGNPQSIEMAVSILKGLKPVLDLLAAMHGVSKSVGEYDRDKCKDNL